MTKLQQDTDLVADALAMVSEVGTVGAMKWLAAALSRRPVPSRELPPLPDPIGEIVGTQFNGSEFFGCFQNEYKPVEKLRIYTADQMREYAALCRSDAPALLPAISSDWINAVAKEIGLSYSTAKETIATVLEHAPAPSNPNAHVAVQLGESAAASVTVELTEAESEVLDDFAKRQDLSRPAVMRQALRAYQMESVAIPFWQKHALGSLARLSCFKCGGNEHEAAIKHMELPNIYICTACVGSAAARVPEGFKLVRIDPDEDMEVAGMEKSVLARPSIDDPTYVRSIFRAMLDASPTAQTQGLVHVDEKHDSVYLAKPLAEPESRFKAALESICGLPLGDPKNMEAYNMKKIASMALVEGSK